MSVLKGEGRVPILFGSTSVAVGSRVHGGYLARPDLGGEWPTIVVVSPAWGVTSSVKDICRRLSRQGFAVIAPDLYGGKSPSRSVDRESAVRAADSLSPAKVDRDLADVVGFVANRAGLWSSAEDGLGVFGIGTGGRAAIRTSVASGAAALALAYAPLDETDQVALRAFAGGLLGLYGRGDEVVPVETVSAVRNAAPHAEMVIYAGVGHDFLDDYGDTYDLEAAADAVERLTGFFEKRLPPAPA